MILVILVLILILLMLTKTNDKIQCKKWSGDILTSPPYICKDCGYPEDCHGPYKGDSWRHIFKRE